MIQKVRKFHCVYQQVLLGILSNELQILYRQCMNMKLEAERTTTYENAAYQIWDNDKGQICRVYSYIDENLGPIPAVQILKFLGSFRYRKNHKFLMCAMPQKMANSQIFMIKPQIANPQASTKYCTTLSVSLTSLF